MIIEYKCRQMDLIQNPPNPSCPMIQVIPPTPSLDNVHITSPEPVTLVPLHGSWINYLRIYPQILLAL
jgi:hypothetical protein